MLINNLKVIKKLLTKPTNKTKIECSRILLDECIKFIEKDKQQIQPDLPDFDSDLSPEASAAQKDLIP